MKWFLLAMTAIYAVLLGAAPRLGATEIVARLTLNVTQIVNHSATSTSFTLSWDAPTDGSSVYLFEHNPSGQETLLYDGNAASPLRLTRNQAGDWHYRLVFGRRVNGVLTVADQSHLTRVSVPSPVAPVLIEPKRPPLDNGFHLQWANDAGDYIYQLLEDKKHDFSTPNSPQYWPRGNFIDIPAKTPGIYYYRVRSWNKLPEHGGRESAWSNVIVVQVLSDQEFLDMLTRKIFDYMMVTTYPNGLTLDRVMTNGNPGAMTTIAGSGFYLSSLTVGAERGWIDRETAKAKAKACLETYKSGTPTVHGYFYHFLKPDGQPFAADIEVSTIDTALLVAGALQAGEYFGGEVKDLADFIYRRVEWSWMYDPARGLLRQAWNPATGFQNYYDSYNETMMLYLLAIGSPTYPIPPHSFYSWARPKGNYKGPDFIHNIGGRIFTYQYSHAYYDFRGTRDLLGVDWWQNSIEGTRANQRYAIDNSLQGYNLWLWGLTACDGPDGYKAYGALPAYANESDGTVAPTGVGGAVAMTPDIAIPSLKVMYSRHGDKIWKQHGFVDSFNFKRNWIDEWYLGIDQGIMIVMLENLKSGMIWRTFMQNPHVQRSMSRAGFSGYASAAPDVSLEDFEDGNFATPETTVGWWDNDGTAVYRRSNSFAKFFEGRISMNVEYTKNGKPWSLMGATMAASNPKRDFSNHELITLKLFGACDLLVKLKDASGAEQDVAVLKATNANGWNRLAFDFGGTAVNRGAIDSVFFFVDPGNGATSGNIYIDDIRLENRKPVLLDDFEDGLWWTPDVTMGWWESDGTRVYKKAHVKDPSRSGMRSMKIDYNKDGLAWSYFGANFSSSNPKKDFSKQTRLVLWVYGKVELLVKIRDRQGKEAELGKKSTVTGAPGWNRLVFDYSKAAVNLADIENILFFADPGNAASAGTFHLDDVSIE